MRDYLLSDILPFWMKHSLDEEVGGILNHLDREGNIYSYEKNAWFLGRTMYTYSVVYNTIKHDPEYLEFAKKMHDFLPNCFDKDGRLNFITNREGKSSSANTSYYSETFAAIGCTEYYIATGDEEIWAEAERYFDTAYALYKEELAKRPSPDAIDVETKALGPSMIMLNVAQIMRKVSFEKYHKVAEECAEEILVHLTPKGLLENVSLDGEFVDTLSGREINPGHSLEAGWFLLAEGVYRNDERYKLAAKAIVDKSMELGYRDGSIIAFTDCDGRPSGRIEWNLRIWWPQCEAIIANRLCYEVFGEEKYLRDFEALRDYCFEHYADPEFGEWFGYLHYDGTVASTLKGNFSKGPYHLPRMLILVDRLERGIDILS